MRYGRLPAVVRDEHISSSNALRIMRFVVTLKGGSPHNAFHLAKCVWVKPKLVVQMRRDAMTRKPGGAQLSVQGPIWGLAALGQHVSRYHPESQRNKRWDDQ
jgi:hypothetical protein